MSVNTSSTKPELPSLSPRKEDGLEVCIVPGTWIYASDDFRIHLNIRGKTIPEGSKLSLYIFGKELYKKNEQDKKPYKYVFCKEKIESSTLSLDESGTGNFYYPFSFRDEKKYPSSFNFQGEDGKIARVYYKAKARITQGTTVLFCGSATIPYCSFDNLMAFPRLTKSLNKNTIKLEMNANKDQYSSDETVAIDCRLSKDTHDSHTDLLSAKVFCSLVQTVTINTGPSFGLPLVSSLFGSEESVANELVSFQCTAKGRPEALQDKTCLRFPIEFDLKAIGLARTLECSTHGACIVGLYHIVVAVQLEENQKIAEGDLMKIPLLIIPATI